MSGGTKVSFHGVRGSTPCEGPQYARYGGHSSCVSLETEGEPALSIPDMARTHGVVNAVGFTLLGLLGWQAGSRQDNGVQGEDR